MLSEERVKHMTRMAMTEERDSRKIQPVLKYSKKDYLQVGMIAHTFLGSLLYLVLSGGVLGTLLSTLIININFIGIAVGILLLLLLYVLFMYLYLRIIRRQYSRRYDEGLQCAKNLKKQYRILEEMYIEEENQKSPEGWY